MDSRIKVALRCRPFLGSETNKRRVLNFTTDSVVIGEKKYQFEQVFDDKSCQSDVYDFCVKSLVEGCFEGYNGTVFAYGQTGSGKTHSIMGSMAGMGDDVEAGIIPRAVRQVFDTLHSTSHSAGVTRMATVRVSMIELYNDECKDLLHPEIPSRDIMIREDKHGRIFFTGAREEVVTDAESALQYLELGNINRSTAETLMNQASSRSHAIFTISLEILEYSKNEEGDEENSFIHAKLHLVDLAGSERAKKTGASGQRLKESVGINQGLLSLGKVIRALTTNPVTHVPYRESKLTRFLQDSLGGNSRTVLLACVSPSELSLNETINTIQYAQRAKAIHNKIVANVATGVASSELQNDLESSLVVSLRAEIVRMQRELSTMHPSSQGIALDGDGGIDGDDPSAAVVATLRDKVRTLEHKHHQQVQLLRSVRNTLQSAMTQSTASTGTTDVNSLADRCHQWEKVTEKLLVLVSEALLADQGKAEAMSLMRRSLRDSWNELSLSSAGRGGGGSDSPHQQSQRQQQLEDELQAVREELDECREDLKRDEEIFAEKMKELKRYKKQVKELEAEKVTWQEKQKTMQQQLIKLSKLPKLFVADFTLEDTVSSIGPLPSSGVPGMPPLSPTKPPRSAAATTSSPGGASGLDKSALDDLDVSIAVALSEPDISQLMEDFEAVWKEKEDLMHHYKRVEDNLQKIETVAQVQKDKIHKVQHALQKKLRHKDALLRERTRDVLELQEQQRSLREELQDVKFQRAKLLDDLASVQRASPLTTGGPGGGGGGVSDATLFEKDDKIRRLSASIEAMSEERNDLVLRLRELEGQISRMDRAHAEDRDDWQAKDTEYQQRLLVLDEQNRKLRDELSMTQEEQRKILADARASSNSNSNSSGSGGPTGNSQRSKGNTTTATAADALRMSHTEQLTGWLEESLEAVVHEGIAQIEVLRIQKQLDLLFADRDAARKELDSLRRAAVAAASQSAALTASPSTASTAMDAKIVAIDEKIRTLKLKAANVRMRLMADPSEASLKRELQDIEYNIDSYEEHKAEFQERLAAENAALWKKAHGNGNGNGSGTADAKGTDTAPITAQELELQDDLEALDTEISALQARLQQERQRAQTLQEQNYKRFDLPATSTSIGNATATAVSSSKSKKASFALDAIIHSLIRDLVQYHRDVHRSSTNDAVKDASTAATAQQQQLRDDLLTLILKLHIRHRIKAGSNEGSWAEAKQQLEAKCQEYDDLVKHMQKMRNDALKRQEQLRKEADEKIAYLVTQLRTMENASSAATSARQSPSPALTNAGSNATAAAAAVDLPPPVPSSNRASPAPLRASQQKRSLSDLLQHHVDDLGGAEGLNQEVLKRWISEKERREQLERRNAELAREIREMKTTTPTTTNTPR